MSLACRRFEKLKIWTFNTKYKHGIRMNYSSTPNHSEKLGAHISVIGNGAPGLSKCVTLRYHNNRILFNCGEGCENFVKGPVTDVCITHIDWTNIGGLLSLSFKAVNSQRDRLFLCGPPGVDYFMSIAERFLRTYTNKFKLHFFDSNSNEQEIRNSYQILCVPITSKRKTYYRTMAINKSWLKTTFVFRNLSDSILSKKPTGDIDFDTSYSYICKTESARVWMFNECVKRGVKPGLHMKKLWEGESVTLDDGTVVQPDDVISKNPAPTIIVLDCPTKDYLGDLLDKKDYEIYYKPEKVDNIIIIIHFTPIAVMHDERYIAWMARFPHSTKHLVVNDSNEWNMPVKAVTKHEICRLISSRFYPKLGLSNELVNNDLNSRVFIQNDQYDKQYLLDNQSDNQCDNQADEQSDDLMEVPNVCWTNEETSQEWLQKWSDKLKSFQLVQSRCGTVIDLMNLQAVRITDPLSISDLPICNPKYSQTPPKYSPKDPRITFLGTSSQGGTTYRNTSGILVQMSKDKAMLLDCGDGMLRQLTCLFGEVKLQEVLTSLKCIYISHSHADHHAGLVGLLLSINKARNLLKKKPENLYLLIPAPLIDWLEKFHNKFAPILQHVTLINLSNFGRLMKEQGSVNSVLKRALDLKQLKVCWAIHNAFAYCVTFEHMSGWKISFSGDTEYNESFASMGLNSDLLIHEATYASGLDLMAKRAKHSTTEHAIKIGQKMNAKNIILTHFSRRYSIIPFMQDLENTSNVSVALDFLQVNLSEVHALPKLNKAYLEVFKEYERENFETHARLVARPHQSHAEAAIERE